MIDETIRTFGECLEIAKQCKTDKGKTPKNHLMLGNGFSIDLFPNIFNYKSLTERVESKQVKKLFNTLGKSDFEYVMRGLTNAVELVKVYPEHKQITDGMENDLAKLREILIEVVSNSHPKTAKWINDDQYDSCYSFLVHFENGNKYTFNYDLLLYWVYMYFRESRNNRNNKDKKLDIRDGFGSGNYQNMPVLAWGIGNAEKQESY
ncbi:MAG: DUF4917 family protein [Proteobacteria bacterium]|nr:DUF4917 family protein [Pseudomonadota bacterium]